MPKSDKPNILIIWGDDIGYWNISHYSKGMMGSASRKKGRPSPTGTASRAAPPAARPSSPVRTRSAPA